MRMGWVSLIIATWIIAPGSTAAAAPTAVGCPEIPNRCGVVSVAKSNGCPVQWQTHFLVNAAPACSVVVKNDLAYSDYSICSRLYRLHDQFKTLDFTRQYGSLIISKGSCPLPSSYPPCSRIGAIKQGSFCYCPSGSKNPVAGCVPNGSDTVCMSLSIAADQCN